MKQLVRKLPCRRTLVGVLLTGWAALIALGFVVLMDYQNAPGQPAEPPPRWPSSTALDPGAAPQGTIVLFAHPRCPCTRATLGELERLLRHVHDKVVVHAVFVRPKGYGRAWARDYLWQRAAAMPRVHVRQDVEGKEAQRFGAFTSGQVLYYDANQQLRFAGGITGSRGHEGNNKGRQALTQWIQTGQADRASAFVFGCALQPASMNAWKQFRLSSSHSTHSVRHAHGAQDTAAPSR